jgi:hypothetical protein
VTDISSTDNFNLDKPVLGQLAFQPAVVGSKPTTTTLTAAIERGKAAQRELDRAAAQTWAHWRDICLALLAIQNLAMAAAKADQPVARPITEPSIIAFGCTGSIATTRPHGRGWSNWRVISMPLRHGARRSPRSGWQS